MDTLDNQSFNATEGLSPEMETELRATYPWMKFFAIIGFVFLGLMILASLFMVSMMPSGVGGGGMIVVTYFIIAVIMFFPLLYLIQSGNAFKNYLATKDRTSLLFAFVKQKAYWRYMGILLIIYLAFILIALIFALAAGSMFMDF